MKSSESQKISTNGLIWLEGYLTSNFGIKIHIKRQLAYYVIGVENFTTKLYVSQKRCRFLESESQIAHSWWSASEEGWIEPLGLPIPAPGVGSLPKPLILKKHQVVEIKYDILGLLFWTLTRSEEFLRNDLDELSRFPAGRSHAYINKYLSRPFIDEWLNIVGQIFERYFGVSNLRQFRFQVAITHDVDSPSRYAFAPFPKLIYRLLKDKRLNLTSIPKILHGRIAKSVEMSDLDPNNTFRWIMNQSSRYGFKNKFFFMAGRKSKNESEYDICDPRILGLIKTIYSSGHEIGVHPSFNTSKSAAQLFSEIKNFKTACLIAETNLISVDSRMHYLRFISSSTYEMLANCGVDTDASMGYADHVGFRCGTSRPFNFFSLQNDRALKIIVHPLIAMHWSMVNPRYMKMSAFEASNKLRSLAFCVKQVGGTFSYLIHNDELADQRDQNEYKNLIQFLSSIAC